MGIYLVQLIDYYLSVTQTDFLTFFPLPFKHLHINFFIEYCFIVKLIFMSESQMST